MPSSSPKVARSLKVLGIHGKTLDLGSKGGGSRRSKQSVEG